MLPVLSKISFPNLRWVGTWTSSLLLHLHLGISQLGKCTSILRTKQAFRTNTIWTKRHRKKGPHLLLVSRVSPINSQVSGRQWGIVTRARATAHPGVESKAKDTRRKQYKSNVLKGKPFIRILTAYCIAFVPKSPCLDRKPSFKSRAKPGCRIMFFPVQTFNSSSDERTRYLPLFALLSVQQGKRKASVLPDPVLHPCLPWTFPHQISSFYSKLFTGSMMRRVYAIPAMVRVWCFARTLSQCCKTRWPKETVSVSGLPNIHMVFDYLWYLIKTYQDLTNLNHHSYQMVRVDHPLYELAVI